MSNDINSNCRKKHTKEKIEFKFQDNDENKLLRKFLIKWEQAYPTTQTYHKSEQLEAEITTEIVQIETKELKKTECEIVSTTKVYDFKSKKFLTT